MNNALIMPNQSKNTRCKQKNINGVLHKECLACAGWFPADQKHFYYWGGKISSRCKPCMREIVYAQRESKRKAKP